MSNVQALPTLERYAAESKKDEASFIASLNNADVGGRALTKGSPLWPGFHVTFEAKKGVCVSADKRRAPSGRPFLSLTAINMDRSGWYAVEFDLEPRNITDNSVVILILEAQCRETVSSFAALRMFDKSGWVDIASMEIDINADRSVRTFPIGISPAWRSKCVNAERARLILFIEAKQSIINIFDARIQIERLSSSISDERFSGLGALLLDRLSQNHSRTVGIATWTEGPDVKNLPLKSYEEVGPGLKIAFGNAALAPKLTILREGEIFRRSLDLSPIADADWLTLELDIGVSLLTIGAFALRATVSSPTTLSPAIRVVSARGHVDYEIFDKIHLSSDLTTYAQSMSLSSLLEKGDPSAERYQLIFFFDGRPETLQIEELIFSME